MENKGQVLDQERKKNPDVLFLYAGNGMNMQLRKNGYSYDLFTAENIPGPVAIKMKSDPAALLKTQLHFSRIDIDFLNCSPDAEVIPSGESASKFNYFTNGKSVGNVRSFTRVLYKNIYPNTDIEFNFTGSSASPLKYNIILRPGADLSMIKFLVKGAAHILRMEDGTISYCTGNNMITEVIPMSYYSDEPGIFQKVDYLVQNHIVTFAAKHDRHRTLVIDPSTVRTWGTYYGGGASDYSNGVRCDAQNNVYISGYTLNSSNIATSGTYQNTIGGSYDAYLVKFDGNGARVWGTYFGGNSVETSYCIHISAQGAIYICGDTFSTSGVASVGAHQTSYGGGIDDAYLAKFDRNGQLLWATYYGGTLHDIAADITTDNNSNVLMCGHSESSNNIATNSAYQNFQSGQYDAYVVKFDSNGVRQWGTYYGDQDVEEAWCIACDNNNFIYITGFTASTSNIATNGAHQTVYGGGLKDAYIAKFNSTGSSLVWATYYGGSGDDAGTGIVYDNPGMLLVSGNCTSTNNIASTGAWQSAPGSADDGFILKLSTNGVRQWGTYFGGNNVDYIEEIWRTSNSEMIVCGSTISTNVMSTANAWQPNNSSPNNYDSYFARFSSSGMMQLGTFYGGSLQDNGHGMALNSTGQLYITGETYSSDSIASQGAFMTTYNSGGDAFLGKFCLSPEPLVSPSGVNTICDSTGLTLTASTGYSTYSWSDGTSNDSLIIPANSASGTYYYTVTVTDLFGCTGTSDTTTINIDICNAVPSNENEISLDVYPVPAHDELQIIFHGNANEEKQIEIYSAEGKLVFTALTAGDHFSTDLRNLTEGIYLLEVKCREGILTKKIIKQ